MSGVQVPTTMMSISEGLTPASASACLDASRQRSEHAVRGSAIRRSLIPVRSMIHESDVSTIFSNSLLVSVFGGACIPSPIILDPTIFPPPFSHLPPAIRLSNSPMRTGHLFLSGNRPGDFLFHAALVKRSRGANRVFHRSRVRQPVADHEPPLHPQQRRAAVFRVDQPRLDPPDRPPGQQGPPFPPPGPG